MLARSARLFVIFLVVLAGALVMLEWLQWPFLRGPVERMLSTAADREVRFGDDFGVRLFGSIRARSDTLSVSQPAQWKGESGDDFLRASEATIDIPWSTLLSLRKRDPSRPLQVNALEVDHLDLELERHADGVANWTFGDKQGTETQTEAKRDPLPEFDRLVVREGTVNLRDAVSRLTLKAQVRTREGDSQSQSDQVEGKAERQVESQRQSGADAQPGVDDERGLLVTGSGRYEEAPFEFEIRSAGLLPLAASSADSPPVPVKASLRSGESRAQFDGTITDLLKLSALRGQYRVRGTSLARLGEPFGVTLPNTEAFDLQGQLEKAGPSWSTDVASLELGTSRLNGEFKYDTTPTVPKLTGTLRGKRLALADLGPAFRGGGGKKEAKKPATQAAGRILPAREFDLPSLAAMDADVEIALDSADFGNALLADLAPLNARLRLEKSKLAVADLDARTASGRLQGQVTLDASTRNPQWDVDLRMNGVQLAQFIKARTEGKTASERVPYVSGVLSGRAKLHGTGNSTAAMLASLDGDTDLWIRRGKMSHLLLELAGIDLAESLGLLISGDQQLPMNCAVARLKVRDGIARPEVALIDTSDTTLQISGQMSFVDETLGLILTAQPKDASPVALRSPVHVEGTLGTPKVRVDVASSALRLGAAAALAAVVAPVAALLALFDPGEADREVCGNLLQNISKGKPVEAPPKPEPAQTEPATPASPTHRPSTEGPMEDVHKFMYPQGGQ